MSPVTRWKAACAVLAATAALTTYAWHRGGGAPRRQAATVTARAAGDPTPRRPIRVSASVLGLSEERLITQIQAARSGAQVSLYTEQLAVIGTDTSVEALTPMIDDRRPGVPEAILGMFGKIGTERAVAVLTGLAADDRPRVRFAAVGALGSTGTREAREALMRVASDRGDPAQATAIYALGQMGGDEAAASLVALAGDGDFRTAQSAVDALARITTVAAEEGLVQLLDAADPRVRALAQAQLPPTRDPELLARITELALHGDAQTQAAAITVLARSRGPASVELLQHAATDGALAVRWAAITALGEVGGDKAIAALAALLESGDPNVTSSAAQALLGLGGPDARAALIGAALATDVDPSQAIYALAQLRGDDIDDAMIELARTGNARSRGAVLPQLVRQGNDEALALAIELASRGSRTDRHGAMRALADAGAPEATAALVEIARGASGQTRAQALDLALQARPGDPALTQLLIESLATGRRDEVNTTVWTLARVGTEPARKALVAAVGSKDVNLAQAAINAVSQLGSAGEVRAALVAAARDGAPQIKGQALQQLLSSGAPEGLSLAEAALAGKDPDLARNTIWALANRDTPDGNRLLGRAAASPDAQIRAAAAQAMGNSGEEQTDVLVGLARDPDANVRNAALSSLGQNGSGKAVATVLSAARAGTPEDRSSAMYALGQLEDPRASQTLAELMSDPDEQVAQAAIGASYNGGAAIDRALVNLVGDDRASAARRAAAAQQLRSRGGDLDATTQAQIEGLLGPADGSGRIITSYGTLDW